MKGQRTTTLWTGNYVELAVPVNAIEECSHPGRCDDDVAFWESRVDWDGLDPEDIRRELYEYSDWDVSDDKANRERLLWIACGDLSDGRQQ